VDKQEDRKKKEQIQQNGREQSVKIHGMEHIHDAPPYPLSPGCPAGFPEVTI